MIRIANCLFCRTGFDLPTSVCLLGTIGPGSGVSADAEDTPRSRPLAPAASLLFPLGCPDSAGSSTLSLPVGEPRPPPRGLPGFAPSFRRKESPRLQKELVGASGISSFRGPTARGMFGMRQQRVGPNSDPCACQLSTRTTRGIEKHRNLVVAVPRTVRDHRDRCCAGASS